MIIATPPPDVEPPDPDIRGARTICEQLQKHRDNTGCHDCHRKIGPLGFALENFDPIGRRRERYGAKAKIDASGELSGDDRFENVEGFKQLMVERLDQRGNGMSDLIRLVASSDVVRGKTHERHYQRRGVRRAVSPSGGAKKGDAGPPSRKDPGCLCDSPSLRSL